MGQNYDYLYGVCTYRGAWTAATGKKLTATTTGNP